MTREEYIDFANALKNNYTIDFGKLPEFCDMAVSALTGGEYIKKSELLQHVTTEVLSDYQECDVIHAEVIDELPTYSIPPVATINAPEEKIQEFIHSKANVVSSESPNIEKIRTEITTKIIHYDGKQTDVAYGLNEALEIIDKHINTETWNGYHGTITAPKGTFDRIYEECKDSEDDI